MNNPDAIASSEELTSFRFSTYDDTTTQRNVPTTPSITKEESAIQNQHNDENMRYMYV